MKEKVCFKTWVTDDYRDLVGINELTNQLNHFHPDIPHFIFGDIETQEAKEEYPWLKYYVMMPISAMKYIDDYDLVIHIDGDSTVVGSLDELIETEYDVAGVRNNHFNSGAGKGGIITIPNVPWDKFLNVGLHGIRSKEFLLEWLEGCDKGINGLEQWDDENNEFNRYFFDEKYNQYIVDDVGSGVSYGLTNVFGTETHWDSWKKLYVKNNEIYQLNPKGEEVKVKVLHMAGGPGAKSKVLQGKNMREWLLDWVNPEVSEYIKKISNG